ncbi:MAG: hypothetical protein KGH63_04650, partial [Candidatus Micrarchaeota archaeon]|nr:hypothetical protein [Candidatus Micrarchaeota archaeon]
REKGIAISPNTFERRLDRKAIPYEKMGGLRVIRREVMDGLAQSGMPGGRVQAPADRAPLAGAKRRAARRVPSGAERPNV